jgi:hypothetical protein
LGRNHAPARPHPAGRAGWAGGDLKGGGALLPAGLAKLSRFR